MNRITDYCQFDIYSISSHVVKNNHLNASFQNTNHISNINANEKKPQISEQYESKQSNFHGTKTFAPSMKPKPKFNVSSNQQSQPHHKVVNNKELQRNLQREEIFDERNKKFNSFKGLEKQMKNKSHFTSKTAFHDTASSATEKFSSNGCTTSSKTVSNVSSRSETYNTLGLTDDNIVRNVGNINKNPENKSKVSEKSQSHYSSYSTSHSSTTETNSVKSCLHGPTISRNANCPSDNVNSGCFENNYISKRYFPTSPFKMDSNNSSVLSKTSKHVTSQMSSESMISSSADFQAFMNDNQMHIDSTFTKPAIVKTTYYSQKTTSSSIKTSSTFSKSTNRQMPSNSRFQ